MVFLEIVGIVVFAIKLLWMAGQQVIADVWVVERTSLRQNDPPANRFGILLL
jgi:hypothetical protein